MFGSAPSNALFDVSIVGFLLEFCQFLFPIHMLIVESLLLSPSVAFFPLLSVDPSPLVSVAPPSFASGVDPLQFDIVADHPITNSEKTITGLLLPFEVNIFEFDD